MQDLSKLPVFKKKSQKQVSEDQIRTTRKQRRKNFTPRKWAAKYLKDSGGMKVMSLPTGAEDRPGVTCTKCGALRFADAYGNPDPATFLCCDCEQPKPTSEIKEQPKVPLYVPGYTRS